MQALCVVRIMKDGYGSRGKKWRVGSGATSLCKVSSLLTYLQQNLGPPLCLCSPFFDNPSVKIWKEALSLADAPLANATIIKGSELRYYAKPPVNGKPNPKGTIILRHQTTIIPCEIKGRGEFCFAISHPVRPPRMLWLPWQFFDDKGEKEEKKKRNQERKERSEKEPCTVAFRSCPMAHALSLASLLLFRLCVVLQTTSNRPCFYFGGRGHDTRRQCVPITCKLGTRKSS